MLVIIGVFGAGATADDAWPVGPEYFDQSSTVVNFDTTPSGVPISDGQHILDLYAEWGVTFADDVTATSTGGLATSLPNRCTGPMGLYPINCFFPAGIHAVGAYGFDFVLRVYDASGSLIYSVSHTDGTAGLFGGRENELGFLGIASDVPISHARFSRYWTEQSIYGFQIDDLHLRPEPQVGTEPSTWGAIKSVYR
jgi:hypothetical protein